MHFWERQHTYFTLLLSAMPLQVIYIVGNYETLSGQG